MNLAVPCDSEVTLSVSWPLTHLCPHIPEVDNGRIDITWTTRGSTLELHALRAWLNGFAADRISHEDITADIHDHLSALPGVADVQVATRWDTAGAEVDVRALPREPQHAESA